MYGYVYKTTNLINGKIYIGQHISPTWDNKYMGSGTMLYRAFEKYGKNNFKCELIESFDNQYDLDSAEKYYILKYDARNTSVGYNIAEGGIGGSHPAWNKGLTAEVDSRVAKYAQNRKNTYTGNVGKTNGKYIKMINHVYDILPEFESYWRFHFNIEVYKYFHIGPTALELCLQLLDLDKNNQERLNFLKTKHSCNWKESISNNNSQKRQRIKCVETLQEFDSITEARKFLGLKSNSALYNALKDSNKTCKSYHWIKL